MEQLVQSANGYYGVMSGRNILLSGGIGDWTPEDVEELSENLFELVKGFGNNKWAYIANPTKMNPILRKDTSAAFVNLHKKLEAAGCKAVAFLDGNTAAMKLQSQKHQNLSNAKEMAVLHFKSEEQALDWLNEMGI